MSTLSVSTWSLHHNLGSKWLDQSKGLGQLNKFESQMQLLDVPAQLAARDLKTLEICHFHVPTLDASYIDELKATIKENDVNLFSILIDAGDITHDDPAQREQDMAWTKSWIEMAAQCGASHARVIAGHAEPPEGNGDLKDHPLIKRSANNLMKLYEFGQSMGVTVFTENFRPLALKPKPLLAILERCEGQIGLCADFGNFKLPNRYDDLAAILPHAISAHAKSDYLADGQIDRGDIDRCLDLCQQADFDGPYSLIFSEPRDEWAGLAELKDIVGPYCH